MPSTKPDILFDDSGLCNACSSYQNRDKVDWQARKEELHSILAQYKSKDGKTGLYHSVSGGKDSTYQVLKVLEFGLNPLCVTSTTCDLSEIGRRNIENIKSFGVDYIEFTSSNKKVRARLNRVGLERVGDIAWPPSI